MSVKILVGDVRERLKDLPDGSVHCVVTSPPYWGLRDYGTEGQLGLEPTPEEYTAKMVEVFREVRRVLRDDGTLWLNLGDSYAGGGRGGNPAESAFRKQATNAGSLVAPTPVPLGLKPKDLVGIPWRIAFALQADGWWLRQDIIWAKPNPMPESVTDRCTKAHEYLFLLTKSARYYFDAEAIAEPFADDRMGNPNGGGAYAKEAFELLGTQRGLSKGSWNTDGAVTSRNKRSVWTVTTQPFPEAHFATFPPALIEPCIKAGSPEKCCAKCGAPHVRLTSRSEPAPEVDASGLDRYGTGEAGVHRKVGGQYQKWLNEHPVTTVGWRPSCKCNIELAIDGVVLDPFGGSGTTGLVADRLGRNAILIELNPEYAAMAERRVRGDAGLFAEVSAA